MSYLARRSVGRRLRVLREEAGVRQGIAASAAEVSQSVIVRMERGLPTRVGTIHIKALLDRYGVGDEEQRESILAVVQLVRQARKARPRWWDAFAASLSPEEIERIELETEARSMSLCGATLVPELLRTADYQRATARALYPQDTVADIARRAEITEHRWKSLRDNDTRLEVYLLESALRQPLGGSEVMADQLTYLAELGELPNISIRIVGPEAGSHIGLHLGNLVLVEFDALLSGGQPEPPIVFLPGLPQDLCLDQDGQADRYRDAVAGLSRIALPQDTSRTRIREIASDYQT
ncbi:helix-turn-helix domain-containing protein [Nocardia sp. CA2R105]|uniref:helix-turn-helix domain-containing protein n=1 Tax=Nocardia coffeae TaxID=2873381 RepID=UPI001CA7A53A|nr:helix-turn-helix transcriptional regulator [Nocardia coffeae]MBY8862373.1 helix-turn-helix domain-containing protein [Nocardia coffeae]